MDENSLRLSVAIRPKRSTPVMSEKLERPKVFNLRASH